MVNKREIVGQEIEVLPNELEVYNDGGVVLSVPQMRFCQILVESGGSYSRALSVYKDRYNVELGGRLVKKWMKYPQVVGYLESLVSDEGVSVSQTKDRWIADTVRYRDGEKVGNEMTVAMHKMLGQAKGYLGGEQRVELQQSIRLVQADGSE